MQQAQRLRILAFTNGTLIDEEFAEDMLRVKNFIPAISVEGFEADTDFRRGAGTYRAVERAMRILKERKLPFGLSCCYTSKNVDVIGSERYFDQMVDWGAKFCWFFTYMPVGVDAVPALMATAQQRAFMYQQVRAFRKTKPLFTLDFWNDGEYVNGCIAGGRCYLHINAGGDIEPCAFIHYSDSNIHEKRSWRLPIAVVHGLPPGSRSMRTICAPARCWTIRTGSKDWWSNPARIRPTCKIPRTWTICAKMPARGAELGAGRGRALGGRARHKQYETLEGDQAC